MDIQQIIWYLLYANLSNRLSKNWLKNIELNIEKTYIIVTEFEEFIKLCRGDCSPSDEVTIDKIFYFIKQTELKIQNICEKIE